MYMQGQENMYGGLRTRTARFDQSLMRQHLMACSKKQALSPFPQVAGKKLSISVMKHLFIPVHCICKLMAESYGSRMVQCDSCDVWFHFLLQKNQNTMFVLHV